MGASESEEHGVQAQRCGRAHVDVERISKNLQGASTAMKSYFKLFALTFLILSIAGCDDDYNKIMLTKLKASFGSSFDGYQMMSYPTNNFGVTTLYRTSDNFQQCDMWYCIGVTDKKIPSDLDNWLRLNGMVGVGEGGPISLNETESRGYVISAMLPKIQSVLQVGGSLNDKTTTKTELQLGRAFKRDIRPTAWIKYMGDIKPTDELGPIKKLYNDGNLTVIVSDVVIESIKTKITVDENTAKSIDASLNLPAGLSKVLTGDAKLELKATKERDGVYTFETTKPVIVMTLAKSQPAGQTLAAGADPFKSFTVTSIPDKSK
jgi:hypothetical protein